MIKKLLGFLFSSLLIIGITQSAYAVTAFTNNWQFDIDGATGAAPEVILEVMDLISPNLVDITTTTGGFSFDNDGIFYSLGHDGALFSYGNGSTLTGAYKFFGTGDPSNGTLTFDGGTFDIFVDRAFAATSGGTKIASFDLVTGNGSIDTLNVPNGDFTIEYVASYIESGYFFTPSGTDMATLALSNVTAFTTTNASVTTLLNSEIEAALIAANGGDLTSEDFFLSSGGQFRINAVPVPSALILLGSGLVGLVGISRRKKS